MKRTFFPIVFLSLLLPACTGAQPAAAAEHQRKGVEAFKKGEIKAAIAEWDKAIELAPGAEAHHWQRGIAYYYAGEFTKGRQQFELHQTVNPSDVENAAWHFLCVAKESGFAKAREKLIPVEGDGRVPMMEIQALLAGDSSPEKVLAKAAEGEPSRRELNNRLFYAHLYLGLFAEAQGKPKEALEHIRKAALDYAQPHYMGDVARVHLQLREPSRAEP